MLLVCTCVDLVDGGLWLSEGLGDWEGRYEGYLIWGMGGREVRV